MDHGVCLGQGADFDMAQLMPLPLTISWSSKSRLVLPPGFTFLVLALCIIPDNIQEGRKMDVCVCVCFSVLAKILAGKNIPEMTCYVSSGMFGSYSICQSIMT